MSKYDWLLFLSGSIVAGILALTAMQRERPSEVALLLRLTRPAVVVVAFGSLVTLALGIWLADYVGYGLGRGWIVAAIVLWVVSAALGGPGGTMMRHTRELAERLAAEGDRPSDELRAAVRNPRALVLNGISFALLLAILVLMVWKP